MAAPTTIGRIQEFNPDNETVTAYLERFQLFVDVNSVENSKLVPTLLTVVGSRTYSLIRGLVSPSLPREKSYEELVALLKKHFDPEPIVIAERYHFYQRSQKSGESIADYLASLRRLASRCKFQDFLSQALRDRLVCGLLSETILKALLSKADLTLEKALEISRSMEAAAKKTKELQGSQRNSSVLHLPASRNRSTLQSTNRSTPQSSVTPGKPCNRCGRGNHNGQECKFRNAECHKCGKVGHIAPVCKTKSAGHGKSQSRSNNKWLATTEQPAVEQPHTASNNQEEPLYVVRDRSSQPYMVELQVNGQPLTMEVDTGAAMSLAPESVLADLLPFTELQKTTSVLRTYTGEQIPVKGTISVDVQYGGQQHRKLKLLVVHGSGPCLMGRDWLRVVKLDWKTVGRVSVSENLQNRVESLKEKYQDVFAETLGTINSHKAKLHVKENARPKFFKPRSVPYAMRERVESEIERLEQEGVIEKVTYSEWASPIVPVPKPNGRLRLCVDYKVTVNPAMDVDQYPLPRPEDIFASLSGGQQFTTLDLANAYNQMVLDEDSRKYVTINTHKGLYQYTRLPFGIASAPAIFQRTMDTILQGIDGVACYIDDIIVTGRAAEEHLQHLEEVFKCLQKHGIHVRLPKCRFLQDSVEFLGHRIDADGIHTTENKLQAIVQAPAPKTVPELRSFLGLINYYGKFIPNAATILHPLNELLRKESKWKWSRKCQSSFEQAKEALVSSKVLVHYNPSLPIRMAGDASAYGIGAVISHILPDGTEHPVAFASRTLTASEKNYSQVEKEALSLVFGVKRFNSYLYGRRFTLVTDHKPLTVILGPKKGIPALAAARLQRWAWILSAYTYEIEFRPTGEHCNADGLSRLPLSGIPPEDNFTDIRVFNISQMEALPVTTNNLRAATGSDPVLSKVIRYLRGYWPQDHNIPQYLRPFFNRRNELTVEEGCLLWGIRVVIPKRLRIKLLQELHRDHPGVSRMKSVARSYMWWPGLDKEVEQLAKSCQSCQAVKRAPSVVPLQPWIWPSKPWQRVHLDFAGPFQGSMFLVGVDAYSKWPEVRIMSSTTTLKTLDVLREWFASHGIPEHLVTDNGPQFVSDEFETFTKRNGIKHVRSAPYHPASNGLAERFIQSLKQSLQASRDDGRSLVQRVSSYLLTYRTTSHATTGAPPCKLLMQRDLRTRFTFLIPDCGKSVLDKQSQQKTTHDRTSRSREWSVGDKVMARNLRPGSDWIPGTITEKLGPVTYMVATEEGQLWKRHADQLKSWIPPLRPLLEPEITPDVNVPSIIPEELVPPTSGMPAESEPAELPTTEPDSGNAEETETPNTEMVNPPSSETTERPSETTERPSEATERRYPSRVRHPPDRYQ